MIVVVVNIILTLFVWNHESRIRKLREKLDATKGEGCKE
jgi:hypothetical protein